MRIIDNNPRSDSFAKSIHFYLVPEKDTYILVCFIFATILLFISPNNIVNLNCRQEDSLENEEEVCRQTHGLLYYDIQKITNLLREDIFLSICLIFKVGFVFGYF